MAKLENRLSRLSDLQGRKLKLDRKLLKDRAAGKLRDYISSGRIPEGTKLTEREVEVLRLIAKGSSNADIADRLSLSDGTVRNHVSAILSKLGVSDRTQAAVIAIQHGLK